MNYGNIDEDQNSALFSSVHKMSLINLWIDTITVGYVALLAIRFWFRSITVTAYKASSRSMVSNWRSALVCHTKTQATPPHKDSPKLHHAADYINGKAGVRDALVILPHPCCCRGNGFHVNNMTWQSLKWPDPRKNVWSICNWQLWRILNKWCDSLA